jgi:NAD(P)-dependent dehydrogenase (short-subunit alcohol dehydrogenase family)
MESLTGRIALVVGGATTVGSALSRLLVDHGARVLIADGAARVATGTTLADKLGPNARFELLDSSDERDWLATLNDGIGRFGGLDVMVFVEPDAVAVALGLRTAGAQLARRGGAVIGLARSAAAQALALGGIPVVELPDAEPSDTSAWDLAGVAVRYVQHGLRASMPRFPRSRQPAPEEDVHRHRVPVATATR